MTLARVISAGHRQRRNIVVVLEVLRDARNTLVAKWHRADQVHVCADEGEKGREEEQHLGHGDFGWRVCFFVVCFLLKRNF